MTDTIRIRANKIQGSVRMSIPSAMSRQLPQYSEWDIAVTRTGFALTFIGACAPGKAGERRDTVALPFMAARDD